MIVRQTRYGRGPASGGRLSVGAKALFFLLFGYMSHSLLLGCW